MEERNLKFYAIIGCIAFLTINARHNIVIEQHTVTQFLQLNKIATKFKKEILPYKINRLKTEFEHICYQITHDYGFVLYNNFNMEDHTIKLELKQDGYSFDISEVLYLWLQIY